MRFAACFVLMGAMMAAPAGPQLSAEERDWAVRELRLGQREFHDALHGLSGSQWNRRPASGWAIADLAEQVASLEDSLLDKVEKLAASPYIPGKYAPKADEILFPLMLEGSREPVTGTPEPRRWAGKEQLLAHFDARREQTIRYVEQTQDKLHRRFETSAAYGTLDGYEWILLMAAETQRLSRLIAAQTQR